MLDAESLRIVLVAPEQPRNIGAVIRVAANVGLHQIFVVQHEELTAADTKDIRLASSGASEIVAVYTCSTLAEAVQGAGYVVGASGRQRGGSLPVFSNVAQCAAEASQCTTAFLFGRESTGLTNDELLQCDAQLKLPVNPRFPSMNLAHAVAVVLWEALHMTSSPRSVPVVQAEPKADRDLQERWLQQLNLEPAAQSQLRQLLHRAQPTTDEMSLLFNLLKEKRTLLAISSHEARAEDRPPSPASPEIA